MCRSDEEFRFSFIMNPDGDFKIARHVYYYNKVDAYSKEEYRMLVFENSLYREKIKTREFEMYNPEDGSYMKYNPSTNFFQRVVILNPGDHISWSGNSCHVSEKQNVEV